MLVRLIYASRSTSPITGQMVDDVLAASRKHNLAAGITGVLCVCDNDVFMQVLEGGRSEVNNLYARVVRDARHTDVTLLDYAEITERQFTNWRMGRVDLDRVNPGMVLKYSVTSRLNPFDIPGRVALSVLRDIMDAALIVG